MQNIELLTAYLPESILVNSPSEKLFEVTVIVSFEIFFNIALAR